jgi:hypothetical protein
MTVKEMTVVGQTYSRIPICLNSRYDWLNASEPVPAGVIPLWAAYITYFIGTLILPSLHLIRVTESRVGWLFLDSSYRCLLVRCHIDVYSSQPLYNGVEYGGCWSRGVGFRLMFIYSFSYFQLLFRPSVSIYTRLYSLASTMIE